MYYEEAIERIIGWLGIVSTSPTEEWNHHEIQDYSYMEIACNDLVDLIADHPFDDALDWIESFILNLKFQEQYAGEKGSDILRVESATAATILNMLKGDTISA